MGPLVDAAWLEQHHDEPAVRIADVRSVGSSLLNRAAYDSGHIAGAVFFGMEADLAGPGGGRHPLPGAAEFAALLGARGIGSEHQVVVYDDSAGAAACRLWWMLRSLGHESVALLDGGLQAWQEAGHELSLEEPTPTASSFEGTSWQGVLTADELVDKLGDVELLDARGNDRYRGENEVLDPVAGHIPTAHSTPFEHNLDEQGLFRSPAELADLYAAYAEGDIVAYCGSGVTAAHTLIGLELAGIEGAKLYPGSWSDWITDPSRPRAAGVEPGTQ
ncbi:MAG: sulfurtransferase [Acidimicrobiia bacterium]